MAERKLRPQALAYPVDEGRLVHNLRALRRRQEERARRRGRRVSALASLAACALLALLGRALWFRAGEPSALIAISPMGLERLSGEPGRLEAGAVEFDDGSRIHVGAQSQIELLENNGQHVQSALRRGWARFEVKPGGPRRWRVHTDALEIEVVGTAFTVSSAGARTRLLVHHGRVRVRSALLHEGITWLGAGQRLELSAPRARPGAAPAPTVEAGETGPTAVKGPPSPEPSPAPEAPLPETQPGQPKPHAQAPAGAHPTESAELAPSPDPGVLERADALRAARDPGAAAQLLSAELDQSPESKEAGLIALVLGQIELDELHRAASAVQHFERAERSTALPAALREQALARKVQALLRVGDVAEAQRCAEEYTGRYPYGSWHKAVRSWLQGSGQ